MHNDKSLVNTPPDIMCSAVYKLVKRQARNFSPVVLAHWQASAQCQRPRHHPLGYNMQNTDGITQCGVEVHQNKMTDSCTRDSWTNRLEDSWIRELWLCNLWTLRFIESSSNNAADREEASPQFQPLNSGTLTKQCTTPKAPSTPPRIQCAKYGRHYTARSKGTPKYDD